MVTHTARCTGVDTPLPALVAGAQCARGALHGWAHIGTHGAIVGCARAMCGGLPVLRRRLRAARGPGRLCHCPNRF